MALLKEFFLGYKLFRFQWYGVFLNVAAIVLVGTTAMLQSQAGAASTGAASTKSKWDAPIGVTFLLLGALAQSLQYAFEEKVMKMDVSAPPMLLVGMEGEV